MQLLEIKNSDESFNPFFINETIKEESLVSSVGRNYDKFNDVQCIISSGVHLRFLLSL